jgi:uncharacterized membrane protein
MLGLSTLNASTTSNGFTLAIAILIGMVIAVLYTGYAMVRGFQGAPPRKLPGWTKNATPILALAGLGVAGYLAYVETQAAPAFCGPIGDCNAVQTSPYARLFGIPMGVLGGAAYAAILACWLWARFRSDALARSAPLAIFCVALFGTLLSLYLTYLEPFVIRAVCIWCLISAVLITLLLLLSTGPMLQAAAVAADGADPA